jgi:hypothetical protein
LFQNMYCKTFLLYVKKEMESFNCVIFPATDNQLRTKGRYVETTRRITCMSMNVLGKFDENYSTIAKTTTCTLGPPIASIIQYCLLHQP